MKTVHGPEAHVTKKQRNDVHLRPPALKENGDNEASAKQSGKGAEDHAEANSTTRGTEDCLQVKTIKTENTVVREALAFQYWCHHYIIQVVNVTLLTSPPSFSDLPAQNSLRLTHSDFALHVKCVIVLQLYHQRNPFLQGKFLKNLFSPLCDLGFDSGFDSRVCPHTPVELFPRIFFHFLMD